MTLSFIRAQSRSLLPQGVDTGCLDGAHHAALPTAQVLSVVAAIGRADLAEDVRHLEPGRAQRDAQKWLGGFVLGRGSILGSRSSGLTVAHTTEVAIFR